MKRFKEGSCFETDFKWGRPRKTYRLIDRENIHHVKKNPFETKKKTVLIKQLKIKWR